MLNGLPQTIDFRVRQQAELSMALSRVPTLMDYHHQQQRSVAAAAAAVASTMPLQSQPQASPSAGGAWTSMAGEPKKKRGRKSTLPPELRETTRRFKKRDMERRRRAYIADKMNALHRLTLSLVGEDPLKHQKMEKADVLNLCHGVMSGLARLVQENNDLAERVRNEVSGQLKDLHLQQDNCSQVTTGSHAEEDFSGEEQDEGIVDVETLDAQEDKENVRPFQLPFSSLIHSSTPLRARESTSSASSGNATASSYSAQSSQADSTTQGSTSSSGFSESALNLVWKPYM